MLLFCLATLTPAALLSLGALYGGIFVWAGVLTLTLVYFLLDHTLHGNAARRRAGSEFPSGDALSVTLALLHLPMLALAVWSISGSAGLSGWDRLGLLIGFGLFFGQVGHPNAHELIHRPKRVLRLLGMMVYATLLIGHHASAHRLVHHVHVGTDRDPNSARKGVGFWAFAPRAWVGSFRAGWRAESTLSARASNGDQRIHKYFLYSIWAVATLYIAYEQCGRAGIAALVAVAAYAQIQILLADYVQHYGLRRKLGPKDKPEPVGPAHSWNSPHMMSSAMMLNAPRHSDHHMHPAQHYPALRLSVDMPTLPHSMPVMAVIALWPPLWRRVMDPKVQALQAR